MKKAKQFTMKRIPFNNPVQTNKSGTMKKLLLVLIVAMLAAFASAYGQNCTPGPLTPAAGTPYDYKVIIGNPPYNGTLGNFTWYVTTNVDLLSPTGVVPSPGAELIATGTYNAPAVGQDQISITWTAQAVVNGMVNPYYLVVKFEGNNGICDAMNMKVWQVTPINTFLLAIDNMGGAGGDGTYCAAPVSSAIVTPGASPTVNYQYGVNSVYARITASRYTGEWTPSFRIEGLDAIQTITSVVWSTDSLFTTTHTCTVAGNVATSADNATAAFDGTAKIYVKIDVTNNHFETLADLPIVVAVDGVITVGATTLNDVKSITDCSDEVVFGKSVNQTIKARPTVTPDPATGPFIVKNP